MLLLSRYPHILRCRVFRSLNKIDLALPFYLEEERWAGVASNNKRQNLHGAEIFFKMEKDRAS